MNIFLEKFGEVKKLYLITFLLYAIVIMGSYLADNIGNYVFLTMLGEALILTYLLWTVYCLLKDQQAAEMSLHQSNNINFRE